MNILVLGSADQAAECRRKFGEIHLWTVSGKVSSVPADAEVIFDFLSPEQPDQLKHYRAGSSPVIFMDASGTRLSRLAEKGSMDYKRFYGFCGLTTLIDRDVLEVSVLDGSDLELLKSVCQRLGTAYEIVADQAGLISPRVICMIINEAFYTLEEGIATREDIDLAMKLGTNYPYGPFEWADRIGLKGVVKVLEASQSETGDERYRVCSLLLEQSRLA